MSFLAGALLVATGSGLVLGLARRWRVGEESGEVWRGVVTLAAWSLGAAAGATGFELFTGGFDRAFPEPPNHPLLVGAFAGAAAYVSFRVLCLGLAKASWLWASRSPERFNESWGQRVAGTLWGLVGWSCACAASLSVLAALAALEDTRFTFLVVPILLSLLPLYEACVLPWLRYFHAGRLGESGHEDLEDWLQRLAARHRIPRFRVRVHAGTERNAFAMGGIFGNLVVIGNGLLTNMTQAQLEAVLAHEIAHVMRRDVAKLLGAILTGAICYAWLLTQYLAPHLESDVPARVAVAWPLLIATAICAYVALPGYLSRRLEYGADRLAVSLLGDGEALIDALVRLHELRRTPLDRRMWTHPTGRARIDAIRALIAPQAETNDAQSPK